MLKFRTEARNHECGHILCAYESALQVYIVNRRIDRKLRLIRVPTGWRVLGSWWRQ